VSENLIQIVNEMDEMNGVATKDEAQKKGLYHRIVRIMVEDDAGNVLLQKRRADRKLYPNCWDNSAAGHVDADESYDIAANRELFEEIGLKGMQLKEIGYYKTNGTFGKRKLNRFNRVYTVVVPQNTVFKLQQQEVESVKWFSIEEVKKLVEQSPHDVTDGLIEVFERFYI
jgi:16S rRNA (adenine1518-N6/adenine1519-N6)-dimethyltransferase